MRILHVAEAFGGGLLRMVVSLAEGSAAAGHQVSIAYGTRPETPANPGATLDEAVTLVPLRGTRRSPASQLAAAWQTRRLVKEWHPDVVHLHSSFSGVIGALAVGDEKPTVYTPNGFASALSANPLARQTYRAAERLACRRASVVGAVSFSEAGLARHLGARRVVRVPNGIPELDADGLPPVADQSRATPPRVVAVGRTVAQRQPDACARILSAVRDLAEVEWLGGGGGPQGAAGRRELDAAEIPVSGWLPHDSLMRSLATASVYLHWSAWDGLSFSVLEAVALGIVVVASDIPPNREVLGASGVCASEEAAIDLIRELLADPTLAEDIRRDQRSRRDEFGARSMVEGWHRLYEELAGAPVMVS